MSAQQNLTKEQLIKVIEQIEKNPNDRVGILAEAGVTVLGVVGGGAAAALFGATTTSIPIITAVTGIGMAAAAPVTLVAGGVVVGGAALYGLSRLIKGGGFNEGKREELLNEYQEKLREVEAKERQSNFDENDQTRFYSLLIEPLEHNLISPEDAQQLMQAVENGHLSLSEAYKLVEQLRPDGQTDGQTTQSEKVVTACPSCSQKLRAPNNLGKLNLTCPKCKHSWSWVPK